MELVYLWVKKYKNIENQGFSFNPEFNCKYGNKPKKNDIKDYINIFPDNIKITTIVGENGSGKSNILEALVSLFDEKGIPIDADYHICAIFYDKDSDDYYSKDINCAFCMPLSTRMDDMVNNLLKDKKSFLLHYNYTLDFLDNDEHNIRFNEMYHKKDSYDKPILLQPDKSNNKIHLNIIDYLATRDMFEFVFKEDFPFENIEKFFKPEKFKLSFHFSYIHGESKPNDDFSNNTSLFDYIKARSLNGNLNIHDYHNPHGIEYYSPNFNGITRDGLILLTQFYILKKSMKKANLIIKEDLKVSLNVLNTNFDTALSIIENNSFEELFSSAHYYEIYKIKDSFKFIEFLKEQEENFQLTDEKDLIIKNQKLIKNLAPWITIDVFNDKDVSLSELSYGQKFMIRFLYSLLNQLRNLNSHLEYEDIILLLDEVENGLHPQWQKEFIKLLTDVLSSFLAQYPKRFRFNIILTSHSPFIISDLPKENIIFLKDGENVSKSTNINPFGANIHTLLSHGFFMKDGLIGEFAKGKIQSIIKYYKEIEKKEILEADKVEYKTKKQKEFWQIQSIIGDDYLKQVMKNHLIEIEKIVLGNDEAKNEEIKRLEAQIEQLRK